ncbi:MAG: RDD family protein [Pirellulales bacterium]|nr:RDD family protein [Pirellulales bacterium]
MHTDAQQLDTRVRVVTPENIAFQYHVAGPFRRLPAYLIDLAIRVTAGLVTLLGLSLAFGFAGLGSVGLGIWLLLFFMLTWFYGGLFETFWNGQTPGKRIMRIRVLSVEGQAINASQAVLRNILRTVDALPFLYPLFFFYLVGLVSATMNKRFQRLGDLACGTMVVCEEPHWLKGVARINEPEVLRLTPSIPARFQPDRSLARALALYVGRRANFAPARRLQIARYVGVPLREELGLPQSTNLDHLLCALYNRVFVTEDTPEPNGPPAAPPASEPASGASPFAAVAALALGERGDA